MTFTMVPGSMSTNTDPGWDRAPNTDMALGFSLDLGVIMTLGSSTDHIDLYGPMADITLAAYINLASGVDP